MPPNELAAYRGKFQKVKADSRVEDFALYYSGEIKLFKLEGKVNQSKQRLLYLE